MTPPFLPTASIVLAFYCLLGANAIADEAAEPPIECVLNVGDKTVPITQGQSVKLEGTFVNPKVSVSFKSHRVFPYGGIRFDYPRSFVFEADIKDPTAKIWTLSGNDLTIMYFVFDVPLSTSDLTQSIAGEFPPGSAKVDDRDVGITLGERVLSGSTTRIDLAGHRMKMDVYKVSTNGKGAKFLVFQDSVDSNGNRSKEGKDAISRISSSFAIDP